MSTARGTAKRSVMARAVGLLSRREHSRVELARKLRRDLAPGDDATEIDRVLDRLQEQNLLSDARFAASLVRQRGQRYGDLRLARDLRDRGVAPADAGTAMAALEGTEAQRALAAWARRFDAPPTTADERGRQGRYLQNRGFSPDVIGRVLAGKVEADEARADDTRIDDARIDDTRIDGARVDEARIDGARVDEA